MLIGGWNPALQIIWGTDGKESAVFGECKWRNEKTDVGILEQLIFRSQLFSYKKKQLYLFSKSGFTDGCMEKAAKLGNVTLVTFEEMMEI